MKIAVVGESAREDGVYNLLNNSFKDQIFETNRDSFGNKPMHSSIEVVDTTNKSKDEIQEDNYQMVIFDVSILDQNTIEDKKAVEELKAVVENAKGHIKDIKFIPVSRGTISREKDEESSIKLENIIYGDDSHRESIQLTPVDVRDTKNKVSLDKNNPTNLGYQDYLTDIIRTAAISYFNFGADIKENNDMALKVMSDYYSKVMEKYSKFTLDHCYRVRNYSMLTAEFMGSPKWDDSSINKLEQISFLHDIGKLLHLGILNVPRTYSFEEFKQIQTHVDIGEMFFEKLLDEDEKKGITEHHNKYSNSKYAQVIRVADTFDAMTASRPYNFPKTAGEAPVDIWDCMYGNNPNIDEKAGKAFLKGYFQNVASLGIEPAEIIKTYKEQDNYNPIRVSAENNANRSCSWIYDELIKFIEENDIHALGEYDENKYCELGFKINKHGRLEYRDFPLGIIESEYKNKRVNNRLDKIKNFKSDLSEEECRKQAQKDIDTQDAIGEIAMQRSITQNRKKNLGEQIVEMAQDDKDLQFTDVRKVAQETNKTLEELDKKGNIDR